MSITLNEPNIANLNDRFKLLQREQLDLQTSGPPFNTNATEAENAKSVRDYHERIRALVEEQLTILASMRKTSTGPARAGGKRAKRAPLDLEALENSILS